MGEVRRITESEYTAWDKFVESSPQGTIFSSTPWVSLYQVPYKIMGYFKGNNLIGGFACFDSPQPLTPFQGILVAPIEGKYSTIMSLHNEVAKALMPYLPDEFYNHYSYPDIRPFKWGGWSVDVRYTYVVKCDYVDDMLNRLEKKTRYEIKKVSASGGVSITDDIEAFDVLYEQTFTRKGLERPVPSEMISRLFRAADNKLYIAHDKKSAALFITDIKRAYYILGASDGSGSSLTLWLALTDMAIHRSEVDLVGCNSESIGLFKRGFGGCLQCYFGVKKKGGTK